jgi:hypothetical protein
VKSNRPTSKLFDDEDSGKINSMIPKDLKKDNNKPMSKQNVFDSDDEEKFEKKAIIKPESRPSLSK